MVDPSVPTFHNNWDFSANQWTAIILSGLIPSIISLIMNVCVIAVHFSFTLFRSYAVNRLSLRMTVIACILNTTFCIVQILTVKLPSASHSCRVFAYILTASDTMGCMCLAMIGLNLVTIFVFKMSRSIALEVGYYVAVAISGILVTVVPAFVGTPKGLHNTDGNRKAKTCWYHFYFDGRINNVFNWMWYYGWIMFTFLFAALCAAISIRFVLKKQKNFTGDSSMLNQSRKSKQSTMMLRKYGSNNTDIFRRIACRCLYYPLVPFITKPWGVGIEIATVFHKQIPFPIFIVDRVLSCTFGIIVGCIYFTDPVILASFRELVDDIKTKYVYNYYHIEYTPENGDTQYPRVLEIAINKRNPYLATIPKNHAINTRKATTNQQVSTRSILHLQHRNALQNTAKRCHSVKVTSVDGSAFVSPQSSNVESTKNAITIPMRRLSSVPAEINATSIYDTQQLVSFKHPLVARSMHWILIRIFRVKPIEVHEDYSEGEMALHNITTDIEQPKVVQEDHFLQQNSKAASFDEQIDATREVMEEKNESSLQAEVKSMQEVKGEPASITVRRASSITIGILQRQELSTKTEAIQASSLNLTSGDSSSTANIRKKTSAIKKMISRRLTPNRNKLAKVEKSSPSSSLSVSDLSMPQSSLEHITTSSKDLHESKHNLCPVPFVDVSLSEYPVELSPRPLSQYTQSSNRKVDQKRGSIKSLNTKSFIKKRDSVVSSSSKDHSLNLNELFHETTLVHTDMENLDNLVDHVSDCSVPFSSDTQFSQPVDLIDYQEGLKYGTTTVFNINNWQDDNEDSRRSKKTESWDINEQLKQWK